VGHDAPGARPCRSEAHPLLSWSFCSADAAANNHECARESVCSRSDAHRLEPHRLTRRAGAGLGNGGLAGWRRASSIPGDTANPPSVRVSAMIRNLRHIHCNGFQVSSRTVGCSRTDHGKSAAAQSLYRGSRTFELRGSVEFHAEQHRACWEWPTTSGRGIRRKLRNTLRLWAAARQFLRFWRILHGIAGAVLEKVAAESVTRFSTRRLTKRPRTSFPAGILLVSCRCRTFAPLLRDRNASWSSFPDRVAVQMNDTHPALCVRVDADLVGPGAYALEGSLGHPQRSLGYTITPCSRRRGKWPVDFVRDAIPRQLESSTRSIALLGRVLRALSR